jgi:hypothetical protein
MLLPFEPLDKGPGDTVLYYCGGQETATSMNTDVELLRRIVVEAVSLQDRAETVIRDIQEGRPLGDVARSGGPLVRSFHALEAQLPPSADAELSWHLSRIRVLLRYHAELLHQGIELLAMRPLGSPRLEEQRRKLDLGPPADELKRLKAQLAATLN